MTTLARHHPAVPPSVGTHPASAAGVATLSVDISTVDDRAYALALGPSGPLVLAGEACGPADGGIAVDGIGRITFAGSRPRSGSEDDFFIARLLPNGSYDTGFGASGIIQTNFATNRDDAIHAVALTPDGGAIAVGESSSDFAVARYAPGGNATQRLYALQDANYNVTALVNTGGTVVQRFLYDPYGLSSEVTSNGYDWIYGHQGGRLETSTGTYHFRNRDFDPVLGRWLQEDPRRYVDGPNLYIPALANPLRFVDPSGTEVPVDKAAADVDPKWVPAGPDVWTEIAGTRKSATVWKGKYFQFTRDNELNCCFIERWEWGVQTDTWLESGMRREVQDHRGRKDALMAQARAAEIRAADLNEAANFAQRDADALTATAAVMGIAGLVLLKAAPGAGISGGPIFGPFIYGAMILAAELSFAAALSANVGAEVKAREATELTRQANQAARSAMELRHAIEQMPDTSERIVELGQRAATASKRVDRLLWKRIVPCGFW